jgi:hypothetical protein
MISFSNALQGLIDYLEAQDNLLPARDVRVIEISPKTNLDEAGRFRIRRQEFCEPADYETRFDTLIRSGLPWINLSCYGISDGKLIVAIEFPQGVSNSSTKTSINYSGPATAVVEHGWNASQVLAIE